MSRKKKEPIQINAPMSYVKASELLTIARSIALKRGDVTSMIDIANSWIEIGNHMLTSEIELVYDEDSEQQFTDTEAPGPVGFGFTGGTDETKPAEESG
jgi:hypothetical protein